MKKLVLLITLSLFSFLTVTAQRNTIYRFKLEGFYGTEINSTNASSMAGGEFAMELPWLGNKNFHYTYNFPSFGVAVGYMNLNGADSSAVSRIAYAYPYFLYPFIHTNMVAINLRMASGIGGYVDYYENDYHKKYFPYVGVYSLGLTGDFFLGRKYGNPLSQWQITLGGNLTWLHDGFISRNTMVMCIPYANLGVKYTPNVYPLPMKHPARPVRHIWALEGGLQGGVNQLGIEDGDKYYPNLSLNCGLYYPFSNAYRMGFGLDCFYNSAYDGKQRKYDRRYNFIKEDKFKNKIRGGIFWANDLTINRFSAGVHIGFYPYNPIKVPKVDELGYEWNNRLEDFMYWKLVTKYKFTKHLYVTAQLKSHLDAVEDYEVGLGYYMPDFGSRVKSPFSRISFKKEDPNEEFIEDETTTKRPFRHREAYDE